MTNQVYANGREVSCKAADGKSICAFPDPCWTPPQTPATPTGVLIPYPNTGLASDTTDGSKSVKISGKETMLKDKSYFKRSTGDEAGCAPNKGLMTMKNKGKVYFKSWSMDVKFEGENVVRHLDLTTHNHGSINANEAIPWPYADAVAVSPGGACDKEQKAMNGKCSAPTDTSPACCSVPQRQCVLIPKSADKKLCCPDHGNTGHHVLPKQELCIEGTKGSPLPGNPNYDHNAAPCICAEGGNPGVRDSSGNLKAHAVFHNAYKQGRSDHLNSGGEWKYEDAKKTASKAVEKEAPCSAECIEKQISTYHDDKITEVRVSQQKSFDPTPRPPAQSPVGD